VATPIRLYLRFAFATLGVIALAAGALLWSVRHQEVRQAEREVARHARYVEQSILRDELRASDLATPVTGARRRRLDWLFDARVLVDGGLRVKLYRAGDGVVTYSNVHTLIGTTADDPAEQREVLDGRTVRDVTYLNHEGGAGRNVKALEVYTPLVLRGKTKPAGVFELYQSYAPVEAAVRSFVMPFAFLLLGALLVLWAALFPLLARMVASFERVRRDQRSTAQALEETSEQLRQSQKMEAIGRLAGGVAHDFNNLLVAINGYSDLLAASLDDVRSRRYAVEIRSAGERAAALTSQLLAFSRRQVLETRVLDLNETLRGLESMVRRLIGAGVTVELDLAPGLRPIEADEGQLGQVVLNLAVNARDAMSGTGTLTVATRNDGDSVILEVTDTGSGMDAETQARIFEPFFTTKPVGEGTGLGLSTVYGIVTQSGGTIAVDSAVSEGTTFRLQFPAAEAQETAATEPVEEPPPSGHERILVVDDEEVVRSLVAQLLGELGYDVTAVESPGAALAHRGGVDLLLTDVVMPTMNGTELARRVAAPATVFMSGYDQEALVHGGMPFLQKPFSRGDLARAVRDALDDRVASLTAA
jgi:signal transduction histidine kinase